MVGVQTDRRQRCLERCGGRAAAAVLPPTRRGRFSGIREARRRSRHRRAQTGKPGGRRNRHPGRCGEATAFPAICHTVLDIAAVGRRAAARRPEHRQQTEDERADDAERGMALEERDMREPAAPAPECRVCRRGSGETIAAHGEDQIVAPGLRHPGAAAV